MSTLQHQQPANPAEKPEFFFGSSMSNRGQAFVQDVDGMVDLIALRICKSNDHPEVLRSAFILQQCAQLGRIFGQVKEADFDLAVETGSGNIDGIGDVGEAEGSLRACRW